MIKPRQYFLTIKTKILTKITILLRLKEMVSKGVFDTVTHSIWELLTSILRKTLVKKKKSRSAIEVFNF